jgi:hypothetical protein
LTHISKDDGTSFRLYKDRLQLNQKNLNALKKSCIQGHAQAVKFLMELDHLTSQDAEYGWEKKTVWPKK